MDSALALIRPQFGYVAVFGISALVCVVGAYRTRRISVPDVRRGLAGLLVTSGLWAAFHVGRIAGPTAQVQVAFYTMGLVAGLATVGGWLYFCSAYAGHSYHRNTRVRRLAVGVYLGIVVLKLTNPIHHQYFRTDTAGGPLFHVVIVQGSLHWAVAILAYALSAIGFYLLFEMYLDSYQNTVGLAFLVSLTGLPILFDFVGYASPLLIGLNYEPIGVALFALGTLYAAEESFFSVSKFGRQQIVDRFDDPVVLVDNDGAIRDYNERAERVFGAPDIAVADRFDKLRPEPDVPLDADGGIEQVETRDGTRHYLLTETPLTVGGSEIGRGIVCNDVTELERQRRELERQNAQLRELAEAINHELRNSLNLVEGYARRIEEQLDGTDRARVDQSVGRITRATRRMTEVVEDLATLARHGQTVEERTVCQLQDIVEEAWVRTETPGLDLIEPEEATIRADRPRLIQLFVTLFEFSDRNDASVARISVTPDGFVYAADGRPHVDVDPERLFSFADAAPSAEFGMLLPKVRLLVEVHGWTVELNREQRDGIEFVVSGVTRTPSDGE